MALKRKEAADIPIVGIYSFSDRWACRGWQSSRSGSGTHRAGCWVPRSTAFNSTSGLVSTSVCRKNGAGEWMESGINVQIYSFSDDRN